jgi:hypothetical protein
MITSTGFNSEIGLTLCGPDRCITEEYYEWQFNLFEERFHQINNVFYNKEFLFTSLDKNGRASQIVGILLGRLGATRHHEGGINSFSYVIMSEINFPTKVGFEPILDNMHKPSYIAPTILTMDVFLAALHTLFSRSGGDQYALNLIRELKDL